MEIRERAILAFLIRLDGEYLPKLLRSLIENCIQIHAYIPTDRKLASRVLDRSNNECMVDSNSRVVYYTNGCMVEYNSLVVYYNNGCLVEYNSRVVGLYYNNGCIVEYISRVSIQ
jgi:hypothetical protein